MAFRNEEALLDWYEGEDRVLTPSVIEEIPWGDINNTALDERLIPVIEYMAEVEGGTAENYYAWLKRTPSFQNPLIVRFIERWTREEMTHGQLLRRFLQESGASLPPEDSTDRLPEEVCIDYRSLVANVFGDHFPRMHMVYGVAQELSTMLGYNRLSDLAQHPVLSHILDAIKREEAKHLIVYDNMARLMLQKASPTQQRFARSMVEAFLKPVGETVTTGNRSDQVIRTLFPDAKLVGDKVDHRVAQLPGFEGFSTVSRRVQQVLDKA